MNKKQKQAELDKALIECIRIAAERGRIIREAENEKCQEKDSQKKSG